ncbi:MAG: proline--tRNA ligase [Chloroflexus sp.]|uniref:proline--tRNA ligase n=1 Tax=Chloroflexus sp. TaxID=1904827 RepID=UPI003D0A64D4
MQLATLFGRTLRQAPAEADTLATQLLWRAGMLRTLNDGEPVLLPLGSAILRRLAAILGTAVQNDGAQEIVVPTTSTASWSDTVTALARRDIDSYRQLPQLLWSWRCRKRLATRPRGLLDLPTPTTLSWAVLALDEEQAQQHLTATRNRLSTALRQCGLDHIAAALQAPGTATIIVDSLAKPVATLDCPACGFRAPLEQAPLAPLPPYAGPTLAMSLVETPGANTIAALAAYLGIPTAATAKALFFYDNRGQRLVFAVVRGDREASLVKLAAAINAGELTPASAEQIVACGATPGYASPIGIHDVLVVADYTVVNGTPLVAGANRPGYHLRDVVYGRDWEATLVADIAQAVVGDPCPRCGTARIEGYGAAIGTITAPQQTALPIQDAGGQNRFLWIAGIELDLEPLIHLAVEQHHDERGIVWPAAIAPADIHLVTIGRGEAIVTAAHTLAAELRNAGWSVLIDDRDERAGVKFNDADLIGAPWRLVVSEKLLAAGQVEVRRRTEAQATVIAQTKVLAWLRGVSITSRNKE